MCFKLCNKVFVFHSDSEFQSPFVCEFANFYRNKIFIKVWNIGLVLTEMHSYAVIENFSTKKIFWGGWKQKENCTGTFWAELKLITSSVALLSRIAYWAAIIVGGTDSVRSQANKRTIHSHEFLVWIYTHLFKGLPIATWESNPHHPNIHFSINRW